MSKKDYIAIAGAVRRSYNCAAHSRLSILTDYLVEIFAKDNPLFNEHKFRAAAVGAIEVIEAKANAKVDRINARLGGIT